MTSEVPDQQEDSENPNTPNVEPTELEIAQECTASSIQNSLSYFYDFDGSQPLSLTFVANNFPLKTTQYFSAGNTYFAGSTIQVEVVHHAMGGDVVLADETFLDEHVAELQFDAFTVPMYLSTAGDSFTVNVTATIEVEVDGRSISYPAFEESFDFTLDDPEPTFAQYLMGEMRQSDENLECGHYYNPVFFMSTDNAVNPGEYDLDINALMTTYPLDPFYAAAQKSSQPVFFERSFTAIVRNNLGNVSSFVLSQPDITADPYSTPFVTLTNIPPGNYTLDLTSTVSADFGTGMETASVEGSIEIEIEAGTGNIIVGGEEHNGKQAMEFGLAIFE